MPFNPREEKTDETTKNIYKSKRGVLNHIRGYELPPSIRDYFSQQMEFCDGYESGMIPYWGKYFKTADDIRKEWTNLPLETFKKKVELHDRRGY